MKNVYFPSRCTAADHWSNLLVWGECKKCKAEWPIEPDQKAFERVEKIKTHSV